MLIAVSSWVCYVAFAFFLVRFLNRIPSPASILATLCVSALLLLQPRFQHEVMQGLETPATLLVLALTLTAFDRVIEKIRTGSAVRSASGVIPLAFLSSLCFLCRTDLFWVPVIVSSWILLLQRRVTGTLAVFASVASLAVLPYLAFNILSEGGAMPISGRVKLFYMNTFFPDLASYLASDEWFGPYHLFGRILMLGEILGNDRIAVLIAVLAVFPISLRIAWRNRALSTIPESIWFLAVVATLHLAYMHLFYRELRPYTDYYFILEVLFVVLTVAISVAKGGEGLVRAIRRRSRPDAAGSACLAAAVLSLAVFVMSWTKHDLRPKRYWIERLKLAEDISNSVPEDERVAAFWPGALAQFGRRPVVPLDGVVGDNEYFQKYVKTGRELDYCIENDIRYLAIYLSLAPDDLAVRQNVRVRNWPGLGMQRLWENRHRIVGTHSARLVGSDGRGWYLVEMDTRKHPGGPPVDAIRSR